MKQTILSEEALQKLKIELEQLKEKRKLLAERIETAREFGDLSENFEYQEAKDTQGLNEARILELENIIKYAQIVTNQEKDIVGLGSIVEVKVQGRKMIFNIVSFNEANPSQGKISNESPIGSALLNHKAGDEILIQTPSGEITYTIIKVSQS